MKCYIEDCSKDATKGFSRPPKDEDVFVEQSTDGVTIVLLEKIYVCDDHEEDAKKEYRDPVYDLE